MRRLSLLSQSISGNIYTKLSVEIRNTIGIIHLNSPKDLNALDSQMVSNLITCLHSLDSNPSVKVIVLLSKLPKVFCAGANIKQFKTGEYELYLQKDIFKPICNAFAYDTNKPVVCGVNGVAFGGGLELALLCDVIVFKEDAKVALPELNLGIMPGMGGTQRQIKGLFRLPQLIGKYNAMRAVLTSEPFTATQLKSFGLEVYPAEKFEESVIKIAETMATKSVSALISAKRSVNASQELPLAEGIRYERTLFYPLFSTRGAKEGVTAFLEKRKADFRNM